MIVILASKTKSKTKPKTMEEIQYTDLLKRILVSKTVREGRNGAKTRSVFGHTSRYSLANGTLPLLTTKKMFTRGIIEELLWMLRGSTNVDELKAKNVHIWDGHSSREHLDKTNLNHLREGDAGAIYGHQWRHAGATYKGCDHDYTGQGVDQIMDVITSLRENPNSRRHVVCAWNVTQQDDMALPPCHALFQFYVDENGLSCQMYQRSADTVCGTPFNIASYSILTHLIAKIVGIPAYEFIYVTGDSHIYDPHEEVALLQSNRTPFPFPKLDIVGINDVQDIDELFRVLTPDNFVISGYQHHERIPIKLVI